MLTNITYAAARNPRWSNRAKTAILLEVNFDHLDDEWVPFGAVPYDIEDHGREIFERAKAGDFGPVADYVTPVEDAEGIKQMYVRPIRNQLLAESDGMVASDRPGVDVEAWKKYRQELRDYPAKITGDKVIWDDDAEDWDIPAFPVAPNAS